VSLAPLKPYAELIRWGVILLGALVLLGAGFAGGMRWNAGKAAKARAEVVQLKADLAAAKLQASESARKEELARADAVSAVAAAYERGKRDAEAAGDAVADGLRSGAVRFRRLWEECTARPAAGLPGPAADSAEPSGVTESRADSAGRIVRATAHDAAQIRCLQALALTDRGNDPGDLSKGCPVQAP